MIFKYYIPNFAEDTVADRLKRPVPALLLLLDNIDCGAGDIIIRWDITNVDGVLSYSPVDGMILFGELFEVFAYNKELKLKNYLRDVFLVILYSILKNVSPKLLFVSLTLVARCCAERDLRNGFLGFAMGFSTWSPFILF